MRFAPDAVGNALGGSLAEQVNDSGTAARINTDKMRSGAEDAAANRWAFDNNQPAESAKVTIAGSFTSMSAAMVDSNAPSAGGLSNNGNPIQQVIVPGSRSTLYQNGFGTSISTSTMPDGSVVQNYADGYAVIPPGSGQANFTSANMNALGSTLSADDAAFVQNRAQKIYWNTDTPGWAAVQGFLGLTPNPIRTDDQQTELTDLQGIHNATLTPQDNNPTLVRLDAAAGGPFGAAAVLLTRNSDSSTQLRAAQFGSATDGVAVALGATYAASENLSSLRSLGTQGSLTVENLGRNSVVEEVPSRISNGVRLNPALPEPVAGLDYVPNTLNSSNPSIANSHINGYVAELNLANDVANIPRETVVQFGDTVGSHGADIVSVDNAGNVTLWDAKYRSSVSNVGESPTFTPGSTALSGAVQDARSAILSAANISGEVQQAALTNLISGNYTAITAAQGQARASTISTFINGVKQ